MARHMIIFFTLLLLRSVRSQDTHPQNQHDISIAIEEMQRANYFSFVMLVNMVSSTNPRFLGNVTFLMPKDKMLSRTLIDESSVSEFLLRHSIPSPLLFDHLNLIPNGSFLPSSFPNYTLEVSNGGRRNYYLNNVKIISRNICTLTSIKCHGIDGVLSIISNNSLKANDSFPVTSCPRNNNNNSSSSSSSSSNNDDDDNDDDINNNTSPVGHMSPPLAPFVPPTMAPSPSDDPRHPRKSESPELRGVKMLNLIVITLILGSLVGLCM